MLRSWTVFANASTTRTTAIKEVLGIKARKSVEALGQKKTNTPITVSAAMAAIASVQRRKLPLRQRLEIALSHSTGVHLPGIVSSAILSSARTKSS